jgi:hypothetical protein
VCTKCIACQEHHFFQTKKKNASHLLSGESSIEAGESLTEERKQREQLLELNHLIARQVMEKSRMVAGMVAIFISFPWI